MNRWRHPDFSYDANLTILLGHLAPQQRPSAARALGYDAVETWWPFPSAVPSDRDAELFLSSLADAGTSLVCINLDEGEPNAGGRGLMSAPNAQVELADNIDAALDIAARAGCRIINALYGNRLTGVSPEAQDDLALANYSQLTARAAQTGITIVIEALNSYDSPEYPIVSLDAAARLVKTVRAATGTENIGLLFDMYHVDKMTGDVAGQIGLYGGDVVHLQIADNPGRGQPGTGAIDFSAAFEALSAVRYQGSVGVEYIPTHGIPDNLPPPLSSAPADGNAAESRRTA